MDTTIALAYVDRLKEREFNKERRKQHAAQDNNGSCCCCCSPLRESVISLYNSRQNFIHCEIAFPSEATGDQCLAYGVFGDRGVEEMKRTFSNPSYRYIHMNVTADQYTKAKVFCSRQKGKPYDAVAASWRLVIWPPRATGRSWWCASFVHACLQQMGMLKHYKLNTLDVDDIVSLIEQQYSNRKMALAMTPHMFNEGIIEFNRSFDGSQSTIDLSL